MILPGSWVASGLRHLAGRADNSRVSPLRRAVSTSNVAPACDTNDAPPAITASQGRRPSSFTCDVPRNPVDHGRSNHDSNRAEQALSRVHRPLSQPRSTSMKARGRWRSHGERNLMPARFKACRTVSVSQPWRSARR